MAYTIYSAIDVGSDGLTMRIYEISKKNGIKEIDYLHHDMELGMQTYREGRIQEDTREELCRVLQDFSKKMEEYKVSGYTAYATSAFREAGNNVTILEQIRLRTGCKVQILSNSEERFLMYKALVGRNSFPKAANTPTLIVDISAGSIQLSYWENGGLTATQNIKVGALRLRAILEHMNHETVEFPALVKDYLHNDLSTFCHFFLKDRKVEQMLLISDALPELTQKFFSLNGNSTEIPLNHWKKAFDGTDSMTTKELAGHLGFNQTDTLRLIPTLSLFHYLVSHVDPGKLHYANVSICEGMAREYAEKKNLLPPVKDYQQDILSATRSIAQRYQCNPKHIQMVEKLSLAIFDAMGKKQGLSPRDRLLLQLAVILHSCGEFINMNKVPENSYNIIFYTEIIGLTHQERELVANIVRYDARTFPRYHAFIEGLDHETYMRMAKLMAIFRLANILDKGHGQKFQDATVSCKEKQLIITLPTSVSITMEQGLWAEDAAFFRDVFGICPELKIRRR